MAFMSKFGGLVKQTICQNGQSPMTFMLTSIRCMSSKLFIGGLSYSTDEQSLRDAFSSYGDVVEAKVITDRDTGRSRGFGFVSYDTDESASAALSSMDGQELNGRNIRVSYANERPSTPRSFGNYRGDGGFGAGGNSGY